MSSGSTTARGYGPEHRRTRREWEPLVKAGGVSCWRCGRAIVDGKIRQAYGAGKWRWVSNWALGHDDFDRTVTRGPEHAYVCNARAAGVKSGMLKRARRRRPRVLAPVRVSRRW